MAAWAKAIDDEDDDSACMSLLNGGRVWRGVFLSHVGMLETYWETILTWYTIYHTRQPLPLRYGGKYPTVPRGRSPPVISAISCFSLFACLSFFAFCDDTKKSGESI